MFQNKTEEELYLMVKDEKQESLRYFYSLCE